MIDSDRIRETLRVGLIAGIVAASICMIGIVESFHGRDVITDLLTLGQLLLLSVPPVAGFVAVRRQQFSGNSALALLHGLLAGLGTGIPLFLLIMLTLVWDNIREAFINVSPALIEIMTFGMQSSVVGGLILVVISLMLGLVGAAIALLGDRVRQAIFAAILWTIGIAIMSELLINILRTRLSNDVVSRIFGRSGLHLIPFLILLIGIALFSYYWKRAGSRQYAAARTRMSVAQSTWYRRVWAILLLILLLVLPSILGVYLSEIINNVGLYILMGLGLNIAVGLAGLLDLGYVTNFAVGAYIMALLTSSSIYGIESTTGVGPLSFWIALPICVVGAMLTGFVLALPVLRMRGDYLAIATLGFGEIIRVLARSDALKPVIGGAQGILQVPKASIGGIAGRAGSIILTPIERLLQPAGLNILTANDNSIIFGTPGQLYYLLVLACLLMLFVSRRLNNSRTGRRWMAIREDEDVAAAMGINTTTAKVLAFTLSAASGGMAGAIFAAKIGSIFPHSFQLLISINVLSLIIVGGIGSIPGVIVGAFALIGVPELLREFAEFRLLLYGIALMVMMLVRPEGLWPSEARRRELRRDEDPGPPLAGGGVVSNKEAVTVTAD